LKLASLFFLLFFIVVSIKADPDIVMTIQQVKEKYQAELMALPGVVSVGIALLDGERVIKIGLGNNHPDTESRVPKVLEGYKVVRQNVGTIRVR